MEKKKIEATIEIASDGTYGIYCINEPFTGIGDTLAEAKQSLFDGMKILKEVSIERGCKYPAILDEEFEVVYKMDVKSFLEYYAGIITPTALGKLSGINPKQIWSYMHGVSKPRRAQVEKIQTALHKLGNELTMISF